MEALRASSSIPGVFSVAKRQGKYLVDGGLVNPVPVSVVKNMGAEFTIAVNVIPHTNASDDTDRIGRSPKTGLKEPSIIDVLLRSIYISAQSQVEAALKSADLVIEPDLEAIGPGDFHRVRECILQGELAAEDCIPRLRHLLSST